MSVHPREMANAARTERARWQGVDGKPSFLTQWISLDDYPMTSVYVPQQCVGTRRCPLVVISNVPPPAVVHIAEKYGMIMAQPELLQSALHLSFNPGFKEIGVASYASFLKNDLPAIMQTFAIDPARIAIAGRAATGFTTATVGGFNPQVFNLVVVGSQHTGNPPLKAPDQRVEYFIAGGLLEDNAEFWAVRRLRELGYPVTHSFQFRGRTHTYEEYDWWGRWLQERWAYPDPASRPQPPSFGEPPRLTAQALVRMTTFWARFRQLPDSITTTARRALVREVLVPVGKERVSTLMVDMVGLAAKYPAVAAALQAVRLTAAQHDAYRAALVSARIYRNALLTGVRKYDVAADSVQAFLGLRPTSVVVRNSNFVEAARATARALEDTGMWITP